ncbi:uncharacterized protein METZ01_LOCUS406957 [marine metagenome]|uniref:Uncharacterized protein n=1 Tax=marine metagenome TaxID=408172 RepID=A0A382W5P5_9ZZZZ
MGEKLDEPYLADIRQEWHWVKQGIEEILNEQKDLTYIAEDVYAECVNKTAQLWVAPEGFIVTTGYPDEYTESKTLLVWLAWARVKGEDCVIKYTPLLSRLAKEAGYDLLEVRTPIPVPERWLTDGWRLVHAVYVRNI